MATWQKIVEQTKAQVKELENHVHEQYHHQVLLLKSIEVKNSKIVELEAALEGVTKSYECRCHTVTPKPDDEMDEYDLMMRPLWEEAKRVLNQGG